MQVNAGTTALCWIETELHYGILFFFLADLNRSERIELNSSPSHLPTTYSKPKFLRATFFPRRAIGSVDEYCDSKTIAPYSETRGIKDTKTVIPKLDFLLAKHIIQANSWISFPV